MRDKNIAIFEETLNICKFGSYKLGSETVSLKLSHDDMAQAIALAPDMSQRIMDNASFRIILCARNLSLVEWNQFAIVG